MNYSRRQLYALGEPIGESATRLKLGGRIYGGGGDSGGSAAPPDKTTQVTELPEWARPYAKATLAKGAALTDINQNPYQTYGANRIAGFSPMQQQAFQGAANMQQSQQLGTATDLASAAGMGALGTNYQAGQFSNQFQAPKDYQAGRFSGGTFGQAEANAYMNPYQQSVTDIGKREAARQSAIQGTQQQGQATQAGAFGGGRDAIMRAERERNLGQQMGDIQAQGSNAAFQQAQAQFNADQGRRMQAQQAGEQSRQFGAGQGLQAASLGAQYGQSAQQLGEQSRQYGAGLGMQGLQTGLQAAGQLGQLGGQQFQQGMDVNKLQNVYGGQMQQQAQRPLDQAYQDFQNQQNYPYKQLGFMSDMIRGLPLGQQSTSSIYSQGPGAVQTLAGLGGAAYGFGRSGMFAEGGEVKTYAGDRGSVTSQDNKDSIVEGMYSMEGLKKAKQAALARRDVDTADAIDERIAELNAIQAQSASIDSGLGSAFNQIPEDRQETMMAANGGIVAFAPGGSTYLDKAEAAQQKQLDYIRQATTAQTPEQQKADILAQSEVMKGLYPESVVPKYLEEVRAERAALPEKIESDKGLAFAMASLKLLSRKKTPGESQKGQLLSGLGEAGEAFVGEVGRLKKEHKEADRLLRQSEMQLATADQLYNSGMTDKAMARADQAQALKTKGLELHAGVAGDAAKMYGQLENTKLGKDAAIYAAELGYKGHLAAAAATMNKPSAQMEGVRIKADEIRRQFPDMPESQVKDKALQSYLAQTKTGMGGVDARIEATAREKAAKDYNDAIGPGGAARKEYKKIQKEGTLEQVTAFEEKLFNKYLGMHTGDTPQPAPNAPAQAAPNAPAQQQAAPIKVTSQEQFAKLPSGTTFVAPDGSVRVKP